MPTRSARLFKLRCRGARRTCQSLGIRMDVAERPEFETNPSKSCGQAAQGPRMRAARTDASGAPGLSPLHDVKITASRIDRGGMSFSLIGLHVVTSAACRAKSVARGGARRDRTDDLKLAKLALSQLSYGPDPPRDSTRRHQHIQSGWWARVELNYRPHAYQACALTT